MEIKQKLQDGEFDKYTKKERVKMEKELEKLEDKFGGLTVIKNQN